MRLFSRNHQSARLLPGIIILGLVASCGSSQLNSTVPRGARAGSDAKAVSTNPRPADNPSNTPDTPTDLYLDARYKIRAGIVTGNGNGTASDAAQVCDGDIALQVNKRFGIDGNKLLKIPEAAINCALVGKIDLQKALGALSDGLRGTPKNPFVTADDVLAIAALGPGTYTPPRPVLPSLLASSKEALRTLNLVRGITLATDKESGTGIVSVTTLSYDRPYTIKEINLTLPRVHTFTVVNTGFDNVDKAANMIFDRLTMRVSINPPAITSVSVQGSLSLLLSAANASGTPQTSNGVDNLLKSAANGLAGLVKIKIDLDLTEQEGLSDAIAKEAQRN
ncbi:MAG: hypothetical protein FJ146_17705 [Deltaproteobacteria bacterium]|nr:hypothetical protein [Deltaproteobacteria bacterium]